MIKALSFDSACSAGYHFSEAFGGCVLDDPGVVVDVTGDPLQCPAGKHYSAGWGGCVSDSAGGNATAPSNFLMYAGIGLALMLLLGFAGGRSSKTTGATPGTRKKVTKSFWVTF